MPLNIDESWYRNGNARVCAVCGKDKGIKEFVLTKKNERGWTCIECLKTHRAILAANKDRRRRDSAWRNLPKAEDKLKKILVGAIKRAAGRNFKSNIPSDYLIGLYTEQGGCCALTGRKLVIPLPGTGRHRDGISIDRIDSKLDYVVGNIQLVTLQANVAKLNYSQAEFIEFCRDVTEFFSDKELPKNKKIRSIG